METMIREHPRWEEFVERLDGPEGCNFRLKDLDDPKSITWNCAGGEDKSLATKILADMGGIDIEASLNYFEENGGYCDCEILFNVDRGVKK